MRKLYRKLFHRHDWIVEGKDRWVPLRAWPYDWEVDGE